ncbi:Putidaredoxin reductase [Streptomyces sp. S4.7]|uniref:NAD(P)/FAD-dependent oxidoreductase n=1 Tax=Streptomyces sp. S4.7 TaxID=2705439 RepID=UPI001398EA07|nr:FAD-dependent oxidoreductase [Streptomyces sp. S4.7]QHY96056.1 Putidaredoxin reductase [Streptomyces sp. S4.7]
MSGIRGTDGTLRRVAVVGTSLAGVRAAEALRRRGFQGRLTLIGRGTDFPPYDRPPPSQAVLTGGDVEGARLPVAPDLDVELMMNTTAEGITLGRTPGGTGGTVRLSAGRTLDFDGLIIATGAEARRPAALVDGHPDVFVLRTFEDSLALRAALLGGPRVAVVGAGFVGCAVASHCRALGLDVTVIEEGPGPLGRVLGTAMGRELAQLHRDHGTVMKTGAQAAALHPDGVELADGTRVAADVVVVAVGRAPRTEWLRGSGLDVEDGVLLDATCAAAGAPRVVAAGDVARWFNPLFGTVVRVGRRSDTVEQARAAADTLLADGDNASPFESVPYFRSEQYESAVQFVGRGNGVPHVVEGTLAERRFVTAYTDGQHITGALCVNRPSQLARYRRMVEARAPSDLILTPEGGQVGLLAGNLTAFESATASSQAA